MTELKTLKEIEEKINASIDSCIKYNPSIMINSTYLGEKIGTGIAIEIREEAIKWIKAERTLKAQGDSSRINSDSWMEFFNISEDDLK